MKSKFILIIVTIITLVSFPNVNFGQAPNLRTAANFVLFSTTGAVGNTGISQLTGNVGTNNGAITGFGNVNGVMHNADGVTAQCAIDLLAAYNQLDTTTATATHTPVLGNGETLYPGVYSLAAAASLEAVLNLDAQGNSNAVFIFKTGGAFTTAATSSINLINGAVACNVFWKAEGAIGLAALTTMRGTLIANNGAISTGAGCTLEGRALSTTGSVTVYGTLAYTPIGCGRPTLTGPSAPNIASIECYALFSSNGAVSNSGTTNLIGDVGSNVGSTTGYNPLLVAGMVHPNPDLSTAQCAGDLTNLYNYLDTLSYDIELLYPAQFGNKLVLTAHTYRMNAAATFTDSLYLNADGNANAVFVIQVVGAMSTSTFSKVKLINGTQSKNVYWKVDGAVDINDYSIFCGTIVCKNGAISLNTGVTLDGRALTTAGAVTSIAITANKPDGGACIILPVGLLSFTGDCDKQNVILKWSTATETNNNHFIVERSAEGMSWQVVGRVEGAGISSFPHEYSLTDRFSGKAISYYRLKQANFNGSYKYGKVIVVKKCGIGAVENLIVYPNPSAGKFDLLFTGDRNQVYSTEIFDSRGEKVYESIGFQSKFDLSNKTTGVYFVYVHLYSKTIIGKIVLKK